MIPKSDLYTAVMAFRANPDPRPEPPKVKTGRGRYKLLGRDSTINLFQVFEPEESDEPREGRKGNQEEKLSRELKGLTKEEVSELREKIIEISKAVFEDETEAKKIKVFCKTVKKLIEEKLEESEEDENQLKQELMNRIKRVPFNQLQATMDATCEDLYKEYEKKVKAGKIIPRKDEKKGKAFAKAILRAQFS